MHRARFASLMLLALMAPWSPSADTAGDAGARAQAPRPDDDTDTIKLWPILQYETTADGCRHIEVLGLYHRTTRPDGSLESTHLFNWIQSPGFSALLPVYLQGRRWWTIPVGFGCTFPDGGSTWWVTPFAHARHDADGGLAAMHVLAWIQGRSPTGAYRALLPVYYDTTDCGERHRGIVPLWFAGPGWDMEPLLMSGRWRHGDGSTCRLCTPLMHISRDAEGAITSMHALNFVEDGDCRWLVPIAWDIGHGVDRKWGVMGAFMRGRDWWISPLGLSASWREDAGGRSTWFTPLAYLHADADGRWSNGEALGCFFGRRGVVYPPFFWWVGSGASRHLGLLPLGWSTPRATVLLAALSAWWHDGDGARTAWATPLAHWRRDADGRLTSWHAGPVIHSGSTDLILPLAWRHHGEDGLHQGVLPLYWQWPEHHLLLPLYADGRDWSVLAPAYVRAGHDWFAPLLLSAHWRHQDGGAATWVTPLAHRETAADGRVAFERILTWVRTPTVRTLMPLWWRWQGSGGATRAVYAGAVSLRRDPGAGATIAVLPLCAAYHHGERLDTSWPFQCVPFSAQRTAEGVEVHLLWRGLWVRSDRKATVVQVGPLWWSQHRGGAPLAWEVLGGTLRRTCNYTAGTSRLRVLWVIPISGATRIAPAPAA